jgi:hypothetical protein
MAIFYSCFNFRLRSEVPLRELAAADDPADTRPIVDVRIAAVPENLPEGGPQLHGVQVAGDEALLTVTGTGRYLVRGGQKILVDPIEGVAERMIRLFLLGSALGILCHQRGLLPLHANAVVIDGAACAFSGKSGAGKSTLAAYFSRAGYPVLCDDVCVIGFDPDGAPVTCRACRGSSYGAMPQPLWPRPVAARSCDRGGREIPRAAAGRCRYPVHSLPPPLPARKKRAWCRG